MDYLVFLNIVMVSRLVYLLENQDPKPLSGWIMTCLQLLAVFALFNFSAWLVMLAAALLTISAINLAAEARGNSGPGLRCLSFIIVAAIASVLFQQGIELAPRAGATFSALAGLSSWTAGISTAQWTAFNAILFGALLLSNEVNLLIRHGFHRMRLEPKSSDTSDTDTTEYNAGRVIGMLERYLMYTVLLAANSYNAIGFIVAVKGIARFKQMDERHFAEYVLVGTLASTLAAIAVAGLVKQLY